MSCVLADSRRVLRGQGNDWKPHKPATTLVASTQDAAIVAVRESRNTNFANQNSYDAPGPVEPSEPIDLHNKEFCVDVSTYQPVVWEEREGEACRTEWQMQCEDKSEQVCADISETRCDVSHETFLYSLSSRVTP